MGLVYTVSGAAITLANQPVTLVWINPSAAVGIEIVRCWVSQSANATSAQQRVQLNTQVTVFPTVTAATPQKHSFGHEASGIVGGTAGAAGTCGINASLEGAGAKTLFGPGQDSFNVLNGWLYVPTPKELLRLMAGSASGFGLHLPVAPATLSNWSFGVSYEELK